MVKSVYPFLFNISYRISFVYLLSWKGYAICKLHKTTNENIFYALILIYVDFICGVFPDVKNQGCNNYSDQQKQPEKRKKD